jgi:PAS domain S-box-containing protein
MKSKKPEQKKPSELRKRAEGKLKSQITKPRVISDKETLKLIHELQVHQIELEMQNDELRKAQSELEESRTKYSDLYDFAPVGYFTFDKHGLILGANLTAAKELGIERGGLINKPFRTYIVTEDRKLFDSHMQKVYKSDDRQTCEIRLKRKNGSKFYAQLESIAAEELSGNNICRTSLIEITERKRAEEALHESKERYKMLFNSIVDAVYVHYVSPEKPGKFVAVNESACRMLGYTAAELLQMEVKDIDVPEQTEKMPSIQEKLYKDGYALFETLHLAKDGRRIPVEINIRLFEFNGKQAVLSVVRNITKRKRLEEENLRSKEAYKNLVENLNDVIFSIDINGFITFVSPVVRELFGYSPEDLIGHSYTEFIYSDDIEKVMKAFKDILEDNLYPIECRLLKKTGEVCWIRTSGCAMYEKSSLIGIQGSLTDISEYKLTEGALKESEEKFRSLVESSSEHIFIIGDDGKYLHSNGRKEFELAQQGSIIGLNISDVYPPQIAEFYREQIGHVFSTDKKLDFEYHIDEPDGIHYYIDTLFPVKHDKIIYAVGGISRDITDIRKIANENDVLNIISQLFLMRGSLTDIYSELPGILSQKLNFPIVVIKSYDIETDELVLTGSAGLNGLEKTRLRVPVEQAISGKVVRTGKPIYDLNIAELSEYRGLIFGDLKVETLICVPIMIKDKVFGTICLADIRKRKRMKSYVNTLQVIANHLSQELDRLEALEALSRAKDEWEHTFDAVPDLICILDKEFRIVRINRAMAEKLGMQPADCIGKRCYEIIHRTVTPPAFCPHAALLKDGSEHMTENYEEGLGGYFNISTSPIYDKQGQLIGSVHMARDITERKKVENQIISSLHEKEILLREIHHRVKNNLQIISSLMKLSSESIQDRSILNIFDDSRNRIKSMALIHEKLYQSTDLTKIEFSEYIESLAHELFRAHRVDSGRIILKLSMESILLSIDIAIPCGLIVNELITNSIKHAFPEETEGEINIALSEKESGVIEFTISDNGIGIPSSIDLSTAKTLGLYIVNILVEDQLEGSITLDRTKGTAFRITFSKKAEKKK